MRINKYLALHKYSTRRGADALIAAGKVKINGRVAVLGDKVSETDTVTVDAKSISTLQKQYVYFAYNKPVGIVTEEITGFPQGVFALGRLDAQSHGLLLMTNDGRVTERLLSPAYDHEKEYRVSVNKPIKENFLTRMAKGVKIEGYITKKAEVSGEPGSHSFTIVLSEGKKHQIRRMVTALGYSVTDLARVRIMNIELKGLKTGQLRKLAGAELTGFLKGIGLS